MYPILKMPSETKILPHSTKSIKRCAELLGKDELVAVPTETVYGLAGNALSESAVRKIFQVKGRPLIDPLITHFRDAESAFEHVEASEPARRLAEAFWPGPLTLVLPKRATIPDLVTAGLDTAAVRVPAHPTLHALLQELPFPVAAPSANPFSYVSPTKPEHVEATLGPMIGAILDGGPSEHGLESTVLDLRDPAQPSILRAGPISEDDLLRKTGIVAQNTNLEHPCAAPQASPGLLSKHYSPHAPITILAHGTQVTRAVKQQYALILNCKPQGRAADNTFWLSEDGSLVDIARNFFDLIQRLDQAGYERLLIEAAPEEGIGIALNDRLKRAAS